MLLGALAAAVLAAAGTAQALTPDQVAIIINARSTNSRDVASAYMAARKIPIEQVIPIVVDPGEHVSEAVYRSHIVGAIRQALKAKKLDQQITCLVTTYDVPLIVDAYVPTPEEKQEIVGLRTQLAGGLKELIKATRQYDEILADPPATRQPATGATAPASGKAGKPAEPTYPEVATELQRAIGGAVLRLNRTKDMPTKAKAAETLMQLHDRVLGPAGIVASLQIHAQGPGAEGIEAVMKLYAERARDGSQKIAELLKQPDSPARRRELERLAWQTRGILGSVQQTSADLSDLEREQSEAAVDNELMMLWADNYPKARWLTNPMNLEVERTPRPGEPRVMMVSRLDGSSVAKVKQMIETSLKVEAHGLDGVVYFDSRGMRGTNGYGLYDQTLRNAARIMREHTDMKVVLDEQESLLQAKDCPNAALYCGWYSVGKYVDSCQWLPGSVGYHVASWELTTLRDPKSTQWAVNLLNRGVCGTLGPESEPYLHSFPKPSLFFPLLTSGLFTQGEVYYLTTPLTSWRITFVGDPLYNPFKNKPRFKEADLRADPVLRRAFEILPRTPATAPGTMPVR